MAFNELDRKRIEKTLDRFIQAHRRHPIFATNLTSVFACKAKASNCLKSAPFGTTQAKKWNRRLLKPPTSKRKTSWKTYWMRADLKWHSYPPAPHVLNIDEFLALVAEDKHACFFG